MVTAPHHLASDAGVSVLRDGGNALEAMIAMASTIAVVYPHMNSIGGDGFWLIRPAAGEPKCIRACGTSGENVDADLYAGQRAIPSRGPLAANTVAGAVSGWEQAEVTSRQWGGRLSRDRLLEEAIWHATQGIAVTDGQTRLTRAKLPELAGIYGFGEAFTPGGVVPEPGARFDQPRLGSTLSTLAKDGFDSFYRGALAKRVAADLARAGCPVTAGDLQAHTAQVVEPLRVRLANATVFNHPPPTQGLASLMILGIFDRLTLPAAESADYIHALVEATKQAFLVRDGFVTDPNDLYGDPQVFLQDAELDDCAARVNLSRAMPWPAPESHGDTVWLGAIDGEGNSVSYIQSIYWEFGSGVVLDETGIQWQNRGSSFSLDPRSINTVRPRRMPFHTLNPAAALFDDGRSMVYGTMGGEGQPQTQSAIFSRYAHYGQSLQQAITAPRWLLGRTWGEESTTLKLESRVDDVVVDTLRGRGHEIELVEDFDDVMGHAGAVVRHSDGLYEGASDPRSDGRAGGF